MDKQREWRMYRVIMKSDFCSKYSEYACFFCVVFLTRSYGLLLLERFTDSLSNRLRTKLRWYTKGTEKLRGNFDGVMTKRPAGVNAPAWPFWHVTQRSRLLPATRTAMHQAKWCCALGKGVCDNPRLVCRCVRAKGRKHKYAWGFLQPLDRWQGGAGSHFLDICWSTSSNFWPKNSAWIKQPKRLF